MSDGGHTITVDPQIAAAGALVRAATLSPAKVPDFDLSTCRFARLPREEANTLHRLIDSQAEAHKTVVRSPSQEDDPEAEPDRTPTEIALFSDEPTKKILDHLVLLDKDGNLTSGVTISPSQTSEGPVKYLEDIHALPEFQGCGTGSALYRAVQVDAWVNGCHAVPCTVDDGNESAKTFYTRMGADKHEFPVLGMDGFTTLNSVSEPGSVIVISEQDRQRPEIAKLINDEAAIINIAQNDIDGLNEEIHRRNQKIDTTKAESQEPEESVKTVQIHGVTLDPSRIRMIDHDDCDALDLVGQLTEQLQHSDDSPGVGSHHIEKRAFAASLRDVVKDPRNFCVASFNDAGKMENVSFVKVSFSTFGNVERLNFGSTVSLTGEMPDQNTVMNHISFCQNLDTGGDRLEVQLDPKVAENSEIAKLFEICSSRMTPENPTDEYTWSVKITPHVLAEWVRGLSPSLYSSLREWVGPEKLDRALASVPVNDVKLVRQTA